MYIPVTQHCIQLLVVFNATMYWYMKTEDDEMVVGYKGKIFLTPIQLLLSDISIIFPLFSQVSYIIQHYVMGLAPVKGVPGGSVGCLETVVGYGIISFIVVHIMVAQALKERNAHLLHGFIMRFK